MTSRIPWLLLTASIVVGCGDLQAPSRAPESLVSAAPASSPTLAATQSPDPTPTPTPAPTPSPSATPPPATPPPAPIDLTADLAYPKSEFDLGTRLGSIQIRVTADRRAITRFALSVEFGDVVPRDVLICGPVSLSSGGVSVAGDWAIEADRRFAVSVPLCENAQCSSDVSDQKPAISVLGQFDATHTMATGTWKCTAVDGGGKGGPLTFIEQ